MQPFSIQRVWLLIQRSIMLRGRSLLVFIGPLLGVMFIAWTSSSDSNDVASANNFFNTLYSILLLAVGFFHATNSLSEHKTADGRQSSLTLPASDAEKFASSWIYTGPLFLIGFTLIFFLLSWVVTGILGIFSITDLPVFNPFTSGVLDFVKIFFLVVQPLALLAAITYNRFPGVTLFGVLMAIAVGIAALAALTIRIVYREAFEGFFTPIDNVNIGQPDLAISTTSPLIMLLVLGLMLLAATYFKFQEKSV